MATPASPKGICRPGDTTTHPASRRIQAQSPAPTSTWPRSAKGALRRVTTATTPGAMPTSTSKATPGHRQDVNQVLWRYRSGIAVRGWVSKKMPPAIAQTLTTPRATKARWSAVSGACRGLARGDGVGAVPAVLPRASAPDSTGSATLAITAACLRATAFAPPQMRAARPTSERAPARRQAAGCACRQGSSVLA